MRDLNTMRDLVWSLYESYHSGVATVNFEEDWPEWGSYLADDVAAERREQVKQHLLSHYQLSEIQTEDILREIYWIHEHWVYSARELSEHVEDYAKAQAHAAGWTS